MKQSVRIACLTLFTLLICIGTAVIGIVSVAVNIPECPSANIIQALALRFTLMTHNQSLSRPAGTDSTPIKFVIALDESTTAISQNLADAGLISDAVTFHDYVRFCGVADKLQAGTYLVSRTQSIPELAKVLTNAGATQIPVQVIEGWRSEQIAAMINRNALLSFSGADFMALVEPNAAIPDWFSAVVTLPTGASLEGFLFPDTYQLSLGATAVDLRDSMLKNFLQHITPQMRSDVTAQGLTLYQAINLASIIEREAKVETERPLIASVYLNRLRKPMMLDADPTIQYALGQTRMAGNWWPQITADDYHNVQSPYNTYLHIGLPPSPIANPGLASIQAAIYPDSSPYFYFRAVCSGDGHHKFAVTFAEQQANGC